MRKSPIKHHVKSHQRNGGQVHSYERGKGKRKIKKTQSPRLIHENGRLQKFNAIVRYSKLQTEVFEVSASDLSAAVGAALDKRVNSVLPIEVEVNKV